MNEELKKALEEGMCKFVFDRVEEALPRITEEMKKIVQSFGIEDAEVEVSQVEPHGVKATISYDGKSIECTLNSRMTSFDDITMEKAKENFYKWWEKFGPTITPNTAANDCDKTRWGWEAALEWVRTRITKRLEEVSFESLTQAIRYIEEDIKSELGVEK